MRDAVIFNNLAFTGKHGHYETEREIPQGFTISAKIYTVTDAAQKSDRLEDTADYRDYYEIIRKEAEERSYALIETLGGRIADALTALPAVSAAEVSVTKDSVDIGGINIPVTVRIYKERFCDRVYIALGSNMGIRKDQLTEAAHLMTARGLNILEKSPVYETPPWGKNNQRRFYNAAVRISTDLAPLGLLTVLHEIEESMGRVRNERFGPRTIDLDIMLFGEEIISTGVLTVPHYVLHKRTFFLQPLADIAPGLIIPGKGIVSALLATCPPWETLKVFGPNDW